MPFSLKTPNVSIRSISTIKRLLGRDEQIALYLEYDKEALDNQYNPRFWVPDHEVHTKATTARSQAAIEKLDGQFNIAYGDSDDEILDIFPATGTNDPVRIFFHGGAWIRNTKADACYGADTHVEAGALFVAVNFSKLTAVPLGEMIRQSRAAVTWVYNNIKSYGGDPERIFIGGHSSGGHQCGMVMGTDWADWGLPANVIKGATLLSGNYDLYPLSLCSRNDTMELKTNEEVTALSPIHCIPQQGCPLVIATAEHDSAEFKRQSDAYFAAWTAAGHSAERLSVEGANHFSITQALGDGDSDLSRAALSQMQT